MTPVLPYYLGCPSWSEPAWRGCIYPPGVGSADYLAHYCRTFNTVEGNTTFYSRPSANTVKRWAALMPESFRFCAKLPRDISHEGDLRDNLAAARQFLDLLRPLGERITPLWLQLPASFDPSRLDELAEFLEGLTGQELAVEVRHLQFFEGGEAERALNRLLRDRGIERICLDSRALFSCHSSDPAVLHAQSKKPRLPPRPTAFTQSPQVRFIGHPELVGNDRFMADWLNKVAGWIEEGRTPYVFMHSPDNKLAAELARRFHAQLQVRLPGLPELTERPQSQPQPEQIGLL